MMGRKKGSKNKKLTEKQKLMLVEEMKDKLTEMKLETEKRQLERYINVLVKYDFAQTASSSVYFMELYNDMLVHGFDEIDKYKDVLSKKEYDKLHQDVSGLFGEEGVFTQRKKSPVEQDLEYYEMLNSIAKHKIENFNHELKLKVARDSLDHFMMWSKQFERNNKVYNHLKELKKKK